MPGAALRIEVDDTLAARGLREIVARGRDPRPALDEIGARLELSTQRRFETGSGPDGLPWKRSIAADERAVPGSVSRRGLTLVDTGRLLASITHTVAGGEVAVGTNVVYAAIHQFGGKTPAQTIRPKNKKALFWPGLAHPVAKVEHPGSRIPARPFLGVSTADSTAIARILARHLRLGAP